jgi:hypothetical protein
MYVYIYIYIIYIYYIIHISIERERKIYIYILYICREREKERDREGKRSFISPVKIRTCTAKMEMQFCIYVIDTQYVYMNDTCCHAR